MTDNHCKSYLSCLNMLVEQYNETSHGSIGKKPIDANCSTLTEETKTNSKSLIFKVGVRFSTAKHDNIFRKFEKLLKKIVYNKQNTKSKYFRKKKLKKKIGKVKNKIKN